MRTTNLVIAVTLVLLAARGTPATVSAGPPEATLEQLRHELLQLPYYGVFDFLSFKYRPGVVTLMGYAFQPHLKVDAERAVRRVSGIETVEDQVETLPVSQNDESLRWQTYYAIYRDPILARYAPGSGVLWGHRHPVPGYFMPLGPTAFPETEPAGDYPIHIIVKNGRISLLGVVDGDSDKDVAGMRARSVHGAFGVDNELVVDHWTDATR